MSIPVTLAAISAGCLATSLARERGSLNLQGWNLHRPVALSPETSHGAPRVSLAQRLTDATGRWPSSVTTQAKVGAVVTVVALVLLMGWRAVLVLAAGIPLVRFLGARVARCHRDAAAREVPHLLDVLAACSTAGLSVPAALQHGASMARGSLGVELRAAVDETMLGARWSEALLSAATRIDVPDLRRAVAVLRRAERLGVPLSETLVPLAADARAHQFAVAMDKARRAPVKMLFPLVFLVLPAFLLLTVVPVMVSTFGSIE